jgi:hypothetical protein
MCAMRGPSHTRSRSDRAQVPRVPVRERLQVRAPHITDAGLLTLCVRAVATQLVLPALRGDDGERDGGGARALMRARHRRAVWQIFFLVTIIGANIVVAYRQVDMENAVQELDAERCAHTQPLLTCGMARTEAAAVTTLETRCWLRSSCWTCTTAASSPTTCSNCWPRHGPHSRGRAELVVCARAAPRTQLSPGPRCLHAARSGTCALGGRRLRA